MDRYKNLHLWMLLPLLLAQISIFYFYWPDVATKTWEIHIHYWLVSLWYLLVVIQPYLIQVNRVSSHRTLGILGFAIAGGVIFTGLSLLDLPLKIIDNMDPNSQGPPAFLFYGVLMAEFFEMLGFAIAVVMAILYRHDLKNHAWWLVASVFFMISPALGRGLILFWRAVLPAENFSPLYVFVSMELIYLPLFLWFAYKFGKVKHPATLIGVLLVIIRFATRPLGAMESVQDFLRCVIQY